MKCLFLGYNSSQTRLINFLKKKKILVTHKKKASKKGIEKFDLIISFGCGQIIKSDILRKVKRPILNLHMSYLPFNKGSNPNFWSFRDNTKKGVTIHEIDKNLDTGPIIFQKEIKFNIQKNKKITFKSTYNILFLEMEKLFIKNYKSIIFNKYRKKKNNKFKGKFHYTKDLPRDLSDWNTNIFNYLNKRKI
jgi:methionyl-tRNA formyltransferase